MSTHNPQLYAAVTQALCTQAIDQPITSLTVDALNDEPGFHWSNPGVRTVRATAGGARHTFVFKRLQPRSRREVLVYRALDHLDGAFMPRLYASGYDEANDGDWLLLEHGVPRHLSEPGAFERQCGLVLARIHASYWGNLAALPAVFHLERNPHRGWHAVEALRGRLSALSMFDWDDLEAFCGDELGRVLARLRELQPDDFCSAPPPARCLIHGAFHAPEITWRDTDALVPLAVDWETARVGAPEEDFDVAGSLWVAGDDTGVNELFGAYLDEMARLGADLDGEALIAAAKRQAWVRKCEIMTWLVGQYLWLRGSEKHAQWCAWARGSLRDTFRWVGMSTCLADHPA